MAGDGAGAASALAECWAAGEHRRTTERLLAGVIELSAVQGAAELVNALRVLSGVKQNGTGTSEGADCVAIVCVVARAWLWRGVGSVQHWIVCRAA